MKMNEDILDDPHWMIRPVCPLCRHIVKMLHKVTFKGKEVCKPICQFCKKRIHKKFTLRRY